MAMRQNGISVYYISGELATKSVDKVPGTVNNHVQTRSKRVQFAMTEVQDMKHIATGMEWRSFIPDRSFYYSHSYLSRSPPWVMTSRLPLH